MVDASGAYLPSFIRVIQPETGAVVIGLRTDRTGIFQTGVLADGVVSDLANVIVQNGAVTDLKSIQLELSGCDAPGMNCHYVTTIESIGQRRHRYATRQGKLQSVSGRDKWRRDVASELRKVGLQLRQVH